MSDDFKPGDVAVTELLGRVFRTHHGWVFEDGSTTKDEPLGLRPLDTGLPA